MDLDAKIAGVLWQGIDKLVNMP
ncbi:type III secretion system inner rod subunit SctI [Candidatus Williamhamiltonella defendens]|nr:type III secretion system inner rod subunit SctI [Candidatus Hamiltonella defensa]